MKIISLQLIISPQSNPLNYYLRIQFSVGSSIEVTKKKKRRKPPILRKGWWRFHKSQVKVYKLYHITFLVLQDIRVGNPIQQVPESDHPGFAPELCAVHEAQNRYINCSPVSCLVCTNSTLTVVHQAIEAGEDALKVICSAERVGSLSAARKFFRRNYRRSAVYKLQLGPRTFRVPEDAVEKFLHQAGYGVIPTPSGKNGRRRHFSTHDEPPEQAA